MPALRQAYDEGSEGWSASGKMPAPERHMQLSEIICLYGSDTEGLVDSFYYVFSLEFRRRLGG